MAGHHRHDHRLGLPSLALLILGSILALVCTTNLASADSPAGRALSAGSAAAPPTQAQLEVSTAEFLAAQGRTGQDRRVRGAQQAASGGGHQARSQRLEAGRRAFPRHRFVGMYGAPQLTATIVGEKSVKKLKRKLKRQARRYKGRKRRPVIRGVDLVATIATAGAGSSGKYRYRQPDSVIKPYYRMVKKLGGRLVLDIQPGRSSFMREVRHLKPWLLKRRVDLALDPEWVAKKGQVPGEQIGSVSANTINRVSLYLNRLAKKKGTGDKVLVVHHFTNDGIRREDKIIKRPRVDVTLDFDGFGSRQAKKDGYAALSEDRLFNGIALGYDLDTPILKPDRVMKLTPKVDYIIYQ